MRCLWKERKNNTEIQQHKAHACGDKDHNNTSKKATEHNTTKNTKTQQDKAHGACGELHATSLLIPHVRADQASLTCNIIS